MTKQRSFNFSVATLIGAAGRLLGALRDATPAPPS